MGLAFYHTIRAKTISREWLPGNSTIFKHVQESATTTTTWLHQTSAVGEGFSHPASKNTVHFFHFSTKACMHMVSQVMGTGASHNDCEFIMQNRRCLRVLDHVIILYIFGILQYRYILLYVGNRVIMDTQGKELMRTRFLWNSNFLQMFRSKHART